MSNQEDLVAKLKQIQGRFPGSEIHLGDAMPKYPVGGVHNENGPVGYVYLPEDIVVNAGDRLLVTPGRKS